MSADSDLVLPTDKQFEKEHDQLVNELGRLLMSHPVAKMSSFHSFAALAQCARKALVQSGAGAADAENVWKTAFTTLYPIEQKAYADYVRENRANA